MKGIYHHGGKDIALVLPPDSRKGGTANNRVVRSLYRCFKDSGFSVLRMNFRQHGEYEKDDGELADAEQALDWLREKNPDAKECWVAGYATGAYTALKLASRRPDITRFIAVTPPANFRDFSFITPSPISGLFVQGKEDEIVCPDAVEYLMCKMQNHTQMYLIQGADHYYTGHLWEVEKVCRKYIAIYQKKE